jgi:hypothetical protein
MYALAIIAAVLIIAVVIASELRSKRRQGI